MSQFDAGDFRTTLGQFASGVVVATGCLDGEPAGFAAQSFTSLSLEPPLVALCPARSSQSWPKLRDSGSFCINILSERQQAVCELFARTGIDKFAGLEWRPGITGSPVLAEALAFVDCELLEEHNAGDHFIAVGRVRDLGVLNADAGPLVFFRGAYGLADGA
ncbi:MAG: flavin reductase family protein [Gammaproteobacteria bacterium]|nr:flavin reductase family protein [Gammaproteobacteria bacterium]MDE0368300.1 flavin reductase family protein [Gammaproteobacteria bacterium]